MSENKIKEIKDKVVGNVKEGTGKLTGNEELELKGKVQKGMGAARGKAEDAKKDLKEGSEKAKKDTESFVDDVKDKAKDLKDDLAKKVNKDKK